MVLGPGTSPGVTPSMMSGLPALPMPMISPRRMPLSAFTVPATGQRITAFWITMSSASLASLPVVQKPSPSRMSLPAPVVSSSP